MGQWNKLDQSKQPELETVDGAVKNPLWDELRTWLEESYGAKPILEYSRCAVPGWNMKYRKAGRSLCTMYPMDGFFVVLVVIGERERPAAELLLPTLGDELRQIYRETKTGMGQKWLMIEVRDEAVLRDVKRCIALRRRPSNEKN